MLWGLPPIHFGKEDGVERTLLRVACQSETFLASPWQGGASIRFLWHIVCQSDFDELVSMASRPVDRGFGWMGSVLMLFHPVKGVFCRMGRSQQKTPLGRGLSISDEMVPSIVAEDGIALGVYCWLAGGQRHYFATRKTPLNTCRILQRSTKGVT